MRAVNMHHSFVAGKLGKKKPVWAKTSKEIEGMRAACQAAATVLARTCALVEPGINTYDLDQAAKQFMQELGCASACLGYPGSGSKPAYPCYTCISIGPEVVHGIPSLTRVLQPGDNVSIDVVVEKDGFYGDNARTLIVGGADTASELEQDLLTITEAALHRGIAKATVGNRVGDIASAIQRCVEGAGFGIVREFVGHGIGRAMHEAPQLPNFGRPGKGAVLQPGQTLAIEPMVTIGRSGVDILEDGWTAAARDGQNAAHFEHTVLVTEGEPEILTVAV